jgi:hypothetical protein
MKYLNEMSGKTQSFLILCQFARVGAPSIHLFGGGGDRTKIRIRLIKAGVKGIY